MTREMGNSVYAARQSSVPNMGASVSNTTYERFSLDHSINLSDAHCRQPLIPSQLEIIDKLPELFHDAQSQSQFELEEAFLSAFLSLAGEPVLRDTRRYLLSYSASCAITMVASHCVRAGKRVALIEPAFDNIPSILRRENVDLVPLPEDECTIEGFPAAVARLEPAVVWLVSPNNPTGWTLSESEFTTLVECCAAHQCTLVLDTSFRFYAPTLTSWSQYDILEESGISYIVLEDTGKTWSTSELKVGLTVCSEDLFHDMYRLHDDLLQSVSPFHLRVLTEFIEDSRKSGIEDTILPFVRRNRDILRSILSGDPFRFVTERQAPVSVDWVDIQAEFECEDFVHAAIREGVHVLPGTNFFWNQPDRGRSFIRIPLARDPEVVREGAKILRDVANQLSADGILPHPGEN
ncbi:pyridoxal phosphate-dependent aminotransferase [Nocardia sp. NPDC051570]|uniref:pyridoxal phosphate-dependent aminotransferase n=1 Tax=Nocardia sp. NPDC051570 TaxID=3364324 RepID=UPI0037A613CC